MFADQPPAEKWKLLDCVVSSCQWKNGGREPVYREPFGTMVEAGAWKPVQGDVLRDPGCAPDKLSVHAA